jgi:hypothetical protein
MVSQDVEGLRITETYYVDRLLIVPISSTPVVPIGMDF